MAKQFNNTIGRKALNYTLACANTCSIAYEEYRGYPFLLTFQFHDILSKYAQYMFLLM